MSLQDIWTSYRVTWRFLTKLCGSVPADPDMRDAWLASRAPRVRPPHSRSLVEINEEVLSTLAEPEGEEFGGLLTFQRVHGVCVMRAATIKAHIKDCARVISNQYVGRIQGERSFSTRVINGVYPDETQYWIPILGPDGRPITTPTGRFDKAVHMNTAQGPRSAIKTIEYIDEAQMCFTLKVLQSPFHKPAAQKPAKAKKSDAIVPTDHKPPAPKPSVSVEDMSILMRYGGVHGYAGERGDGEGRYIFTLTPVTGGPAS